MGDRRGDRRVDEEGDEEEGEGEGEGEGEEQQQQAEAEEGRTRKAGPPNSRKTLASEQQSGCKVVQQRTRSARPFGLGGRLR